MQKKYKEMFNKIGELLFEINQQAIKEEDEDARSLSSYLLEIMETRGV